MVPPGRPVAPGIPVFRAVVVLVIWKGAELEAFDGRPLVISATEVAAVAGTVAAEELIVSSC